MDYRTYRKCTQHGTSSPNFYGIPKTHKKGHPHGAIVAIRGPVAYGLAKKFARILKPVLVKSIHHVNNVHRTHPTTSLFGQGNTLPFVTLKHFTSVPVEPAIEVIKHRLEQDTELPTKEQYQCFTSYNN